MVLDKLHDIYLYIYIHVYIYISTHIHICIYIHVFICKSTQICISIQFIYIHLRTHDFVIIHAPALSLPSASSGAFGPYGEFKGKGLMS